MDISSLWAEGSEDEGEPSLASTGSGEAERLLVTRQRRTRTRSAAAPSNAPPNKRQQPAPPSTPDRAQPEPQYAPSDASSTATAPYPHHPVSAAALTTPQRRPSAPPSTPAQPGPAGTSGGGGLVLVPSRELQLSGDLAAALEAELQEIERKYIDAELPPRRSSPGSTRRWSAAQSPAASGGGAGAAALRPSSVSRHYQLHPEAAPPLHAHHSHHHLVAPHQQHQRHTHHILHQRAEGYPQHETCDPGTATTHEQYPLPPMAGMPVAFAPHDVAAGVGLAWAPVPLPSHLPGLGVPATATSAFGGPTTGAARSLLPLFQVELAPGAGASAGGADGAQLGEPVQGSASTGVRDGKPSTDTLSQLLSRLQQQHPYGHGHDVDGPGSPAVQALGQGLQTVHGAYDRLESRVRELRALVSSSPHSSAPPSTATSARNSPGRSETGRGQVLGADSSPAQRQSGTLESWGANELQGANMTSHATLSIGGRGSGHDSSNGGTRGEQAAGSNGEVGSATRALDLLLGLNMAGGDIAASRQGQATVAADTATSALTGGELDGDGAADRAAAAATIPAHVPRSSPDGSSGGASQATGSRTSTAVGMRNNGWVSTPTATSTGSIASGSLASEVTLRYTPHLSQTPQLSHLGERHRQQQQQQQPSHMAQPQHWRQHHDAAAGGHAQHGEPQEEREARISDADALVPLVGQGREEELHSGNPLSRTLPDGGAAVMDARARLAAVTAASTRSAAAAAAAAKADADEDAAREAARHLPQPTVFQTVLAADRAARVHGRQLATLDASALLPPAHVTSVIKPLLRLARDSDAAADADGSKAYGMPASGESTQRAAGSGQAGEQPDASAAAAAAAARAEEEALELLEALEWSVAADAAALDDEFLAVLGRRLGHLDLAHVNGDGAAAGSVPRCGTAHSAAGVDTGAAFGGPAAAAVAAAMAAAAGTAGGGQGLETELLRAARHTALGAVQSRLEQLQARYESRRRHRRVASTSSAAGDSEAMAAAASTGAAAAAGSSTPSKGLRGILAQCASPSRYAAAGGTSSPAAAAAGGGALAPGYSRSPRYAAPAAAASTAHPPPLTGARRLYAATGGLTLPHTADAFAHVQNAGGAGHASSPACAPAGQQPPPHQSANGQTQPSAPLLAATSRPSPAASRGYSTRTSAAPVGTAATDAATAVASSVSFAESGMHLPPATTPEELEELRALCGMAQHLPQLGPLERVKLWGRVGEVLAHKLARASQAAQPQRQQQRRWRPGRFADRPVGGSRYATPVKAADPEAEEHDEGAGSQGSEGQAAGQPQWGSIHSGGSPTRGYAAVWERRQNSTGSGRPRGRSASPTRNSEGPNSPDRQSPGGAAKLPAPQANPAAAQDGGRLRLVAAQQRSPSPVAAVLPGTGAAGAGDAGGGAALLDSAMEVVHRLIAPNATLAQAMSLNWKAVRTHLATQEAAASPQRLALSPKR